MYKQELPGKHFIEKFSTQAGLWSCLWGIVVIKSIDVGRSIPLLVAPFPIHSVQNCVRETKLIHCTANQEENEDFFKIFSLLLDMSRATLSFCLDFLTLIDYNEEL